MILVIIAVLMTDTINTLTRTTDTVVTVAREKHTLTIIMTTHTRFYNIVYHLGIVVDLTHQRKTAADTLLSTDTIGVWGTAHNIVYDQRYNGNSKQVS